MEVITEPRTPARVAPVDAPASNPAAVTAGILALAAVACLAGVFGGPGLGDHETLAAQCARTMRLTGDWLLPTFLDVPWTRKPPLPYWLIAAASYLFPNDARTGLPVTAAAARFPSALAGLGTILLIWKLATLMFSARAGRVAAVIASSTVLFLLYSPNATAEMPLTFFCTWAVLEFWLAVGVRGSAGRRRLHMVLFYVALGLAMLTKGPVPLPLVAVPLAAWWYLHRPLRFIARGGPRASKRALVNFARGLWPRTVRAFQELWLLPGIVLFAAFFVPWMVAVGQRYPLAWREWNWQYFQRAQGDYLDSKDRPPWYYLPYVIGFTAPWFFLLFEAAVAPWLRRYARVHKPLLFAGLWTLVGLAIMSAEPFKKPYYILPAMPGLILLMAAVADRFYAQPVAARRWMWLAWGLAAVGLVAAVIAGGVWMNQQDDLARVAGRLTAVAGVAAAGLLVAGAVHIRGRAWAALGIMAVTTVLAFHTIWNTTGAMLDNLDRAEALARVLDEQQVPRDAKVLWADGRPDSRVDFYFDRHTGYMIRPSEIVDVILDRTQDEMDLHIMAFTRARQLLESPEPVYLIWERRNFERAREQSLTGEVIASVRRGEDPRKDWVVVTNRKR